MTPSLQHAPLEIVRMDRAQPSTSAASIEDDLTTHSHRIPPVKMTREARIRPSSTLSAWPRRCLLVALVSITLSTVCARQEPYWDDAVSGQSSAKKLFTNEWAVEIPGASDEVADAIAAKHGLSNKGRVIDGEDYFIFNAPLMRKKATRKSRSLSINGLSHEPEVLWMEQQVVRKRVKRDFKKPRSHLYAIDNDIVEDASISKSRNRQRQKIDPNDPLWTDMWYLNRADSNNGKLDHNVQEAWDLGYTGKDVVVTILDDGLERTHPDIKDNYDPKASYDVNDNDDDPTPRYEFSDENRHGTRCAGEVAAVFNNTLCIVGIAYNAKIGGIRMLDGDVTDAVESKSLSHGLHHIDVYSASWGPDDDGRTVDGPAKLTKTAFERGIREGRKGKGSIFVWASGNGGKDGDSCNCDGYTNSIFTLSISSATESGNIPWYSEACSSTLATAYSSGAAGEKMIVTTDLHHGCTTLHTGTSASAPLAAGIVALALEANPTLTWRDLQHLVVRTARPIHLQAGDWTTNGVGRNVSHSFGYGLMDAGAMVRLARNWTTVPEQHKCRTTYPTRFRSVPHGNRLQLQLYTEGCDTSSDNQVIYLEHVQAIISLKAARRGEISIALTSPSNTRSTLLTKRARDTSRAGFNDWAFMTTHNWGELATGLWTLEIANDGWDDAELIKWELVMYGTAEPVGPNGGGHETGLSPRSIPVKDVSSSTTSMPSTLLTLLSISLCIALFL